MVKRVDYIKFHNIASKKGHIKQINVQMYCIYKINKNNKRKVKKLQGINFFPKFQFFLNNLVHSCVT